MNPSTLYGMLTVICTMGKETVNQGMGLGNKGEEREVI